MGIIADTFRMQSGTVTGTGIMQISGWDENWHTGSAKIVWNASEEN